MHPGQDREMMMKKQLGFIFAGVATALCLVLGHSAVGATYYWNGSGNITTTASWGTNTDGSGANPSDFTTAGQIFDIQNGQTATLIANWTVSGSLSKIVIETNGTLAAGSHTLSNGSSGAIDIASGATLSTSASYSGLNFGSISSSSLFIYSGSSSSFSTSGKTYGNLQFQSSTSASTPGDININGTFTLAANTAQIVSSSTPHTWTIGGDVAINSGTIFALASNSSSSTGDAVLNISGGSTNNGTISKGGLSTGTATINFNGTGSSNATWGVNSGNFNVTVGGGKTITFSDALNNGTGTIGVTGTLKLGSSGSISGTGGITVNGGGTLLLGASNKIADTASVALAGGTFNTGGFSETVGALTLSGNSALDFGSSGTCVVTFSNTNGSSWSGTLTLLNFTGSDQLSFGTSGYSNLNPTTLAAISYTSGGITYKGNSLNGSGNVVFVAVPESATVISGLLILSVVGYRERRRLGTLLAF